ncbi:MAG: GmrSD restriction endonuclease domain-containing protein [Gammaproteobacteria bacterium]
MGLEQGKVREIVDKAVTHRWGVPEFQRGFVWTPQKVRDLIDSLWRGYPVGSFLIWYSPDEGVQPRISEDAQDPSAWIVDGQQRTTALCLLLGRKPYWWGEEWNQKLARHDVRFNVLAEEEPYFSLRTAAMRGDVGNPWVSVRELLSADDETLSVIVQRLLQALAMPQSKFGMLWTRLDSVRKVRDIDIPIINVALDIEEVTEIFGRLNSAGTKVTEADIALALAASHNPGWARKEFLPFVDALEEAGFDIDPNVVFRSMVAIGLGRTRLKEVPRKYWTSDDLHKTWKKTNAAWRTTIHYIEQRGILSADILPTKNALIPFVILADHFPEALGTDLPFAWFLHATRSGRYSGSALTALDADVKAIDQASGAQAALKALREHLPPWEPLTPDDFLQDYRDRFLRLLTYLVMHDRGARDWMSRERLGFQGVELLESFSPQWHHIFPRAYLRKERIEDRLWDMFANIAVLAPTTNIRFGAKHPMAYLERYNVDEALLTEQLIPDRSLLVIDRYPEFLNQRAFALAKAANEYIAHLAAEKAFATVSHELPLETIGGDSEIQEPSLARELQRTTIDPLESTTRAYWERRASPETVRLADRMLELIRSFVDGYELKYNKHYVGLAKDGKVNNFVFFRPREHLIKVELKLEKSNQTTRRLEGAGVELLKYNQRSGRYRFRVSAADIESNAALLTDVMREAYLERAG